MKASAEISIKNEIAAIRFDIFEAVWRYMMLDNLTLMADPKAGYLSIYSLATGKELQKSDMSEQALEKLKAAKYYELNFNIGDDSTSVIKLESIDLTGEFIAAIDAQSKGKTATAIEHYKTVLEANPSLYKAHYLLGRCYRIQNNLDEAEACYKKAIDLAPYAPEAYCNLGILYQKKGNEDLAQSYFKRTLEIDNFYCNALLKRASWFLENQPESLDLKLFNLRLSTVHSDVTSAQNHIKSYMEKLGCDKISFADNQTAIFSDYADSKLQKQLKNISDYIQNGAFNAASSAINAIMNDAKESKFFNKISGRCNTLASRVVRLLKETAFEDNIAREFKRIVENTQSEEEADKALAKETEKAVNAAEAKYNPEVAAAAIAELENEVDANGDFCQPIAGPVEKEVTEEELAEARAEQAMMADAEHSETASSAEVDEHAEVKPEQPIVAEIVQVEPAQVKPEKVVAVEESSVPESEQPTVSEPVQMEAEKIAEDDELAAARAEQAMLADTNPAPVKPEMKDYKSPVKGVKPVTVKEFVLMVITEVMVDGEMNEAERNLLRKLKETLKISDEDFSKMMAYIRDQLKSKGTLTGKAGEFDPKRLFKRICKAAMRDGVIENSEKKILVYACKMFKISESDAKSIMTEVAK